MLKGVWDRLYRSSLSISEWSGHHSWSVAPRWQLQQQQWLRDWSALRLVLRSHLSGCYSMKCMTLGKMWMKHMVYLLSVTPFLMAAAVLIGQLCLYSEAWNSCDILEGQHQLPPNLPSFTPFGIPWYQCTELLHCISANMMESSPEAVRYIWGQTQKICGTTSPSICPYLLAEQGELLSHPVCVPPQDRCPGPCDPKLRSPNFCLFLHGSEHYITYLWMMLHWWQPKIDYFLDPTISRLSSLYHMKWKMLISGSDLVWHRPCCGHWAEQTC